MITQLLGVILDRIKPKHWITESPSHLFGVALNVPVGVVVIQNCDLLMK